MWKDLAPGRAHVKPIAAGILGKISVERKAALKCLYLFFPRQTQQITIKRFNKCINELLGMVVAVNNVGV